MDTHDELSPPTSHHSAPQPAAALAAHPAAHSAHDAATQPEQPAPQRTDRATRLRQLREETFDLLVVGGGITGAGVARDAALRGLRVALVERGDFAGGTSSRSSKLVHGGLRYLENFEFGLVFESTRERKIQRALNPNLVWPQPFVFPVFKDGPHSLLKIDLGLWLYDLLAMFRSWRMHKRLNAHRTAETVPALRADGLRGSLLYYDCRTDDARLTLANVLDAERHGAVALNYAAMERPLLEGDESPAVRGAVVRDGETGETFEVRARHLVYALGVWTDGTPEAPGEGRLLRPTKGVHIVVPHERLPLDQAIVLSAVDDGRVVFAIPSGTTTYVGTTDTDFDGDPDAIRATGDDVSYLLRTANAFFPDAQLTAADVQSTWAGLRPLIRDESDSAYGTSREHRRFDDPRGITTMAGGKLTTYRAMAEEVVDAALERLGPLLAGEGRAATRCRTAKVPLDPELRPCEDPVHGPSDPLDNTLWRLHGSREAWVRQRMEAIPAERASLCPDQPFVLAQVALAVQAEHARTVTDVLVRRLPVFFVARDQGLGCAAGVARHMAALLGRDAAWAEAQVAAYQALVAASRTGARTLDGAAQPTPVVS